VDVDRFIAVHTPTWERLEALTKRAERGVSRMPKPELEELVDLYQRTSTQLSQARTTYADSALTARLTRLVARASAVIYGTRARTLRAAGRFFTGTFPAAVWATRWAILVSFLLFMLPAIAVGSWLATSDRARDAAAPEQVREALLNEDFANYYTENPSVVFSSTVSTNNIRVGFLAFAAGIVFIPFPCALTAYVLLQNGLNVGLAGGLFANADRLPFFFGLILPHGLLELTAVFIAGGAGLQLGWTLVDPGDRTRGQALLEEGRRAVAILMGLVLVFVVAGLIEGFVTGSALPTWARVGIGTVVEVTFLVYVVLLGRAAAARGLTGALGEDDERGWTTLGRPDPA